MGQGVILESKMGSKAEKCNKDWERNGYLVLFDLLLIESSRPRVVFMSHSRQIESCTKSFEGDGLSSCSTIHFDLLPRLPIQLGLVFDHILERSLHRHIWEIPRP